jgi:hypothetical protein
MRMRQAACAIGAILLWAPPALAQIDFASTSLKVGDFVFVTTPAGKTISGRVGDIQADRLTLNGFDFKPEPRLLIERRGDSVKDGACKGMIVGSLLTFVIAAANGTKMNDIPALLLFYAGPHAFWGATVDWLHTGRTTVFSGLATSDAVGDRHDAVFRLTFTF